MNQPAPDHPPADNEPTPGQVYNIVTDTVSGVNVRRWDNALQAIVSAVCVALGIAIGWLTSYLRGWDQLMGVLLGTFIGLLVGLFGSGIFLMIFRAVRHMRGKHD